MGSVSALKVGFMQAASGEWRRESARCVTPSPTLRPIAKSGGQSRSVHPESTWTVPSEEQREHQGASTRPRPRENRFRSHAEKGERPPVGVFFTMTPLRKIGQCRSSAMIICGNKEFSS